MLDVVCAVLPGKYVCSWDKYPRVRFEFTRLDQRWGNLTAEMAVSVSVNCDGETRIITKLSHIRTELSSISVRSTVAKELAALKFDDVLELPLEPDERATFAPASTDRIDWRGLVETSYNAVIDEYRRSEPAREIRADGHAVDLPKVLVDPFIVSGVPNAIFGDRGASKSTLALALVAMVTGQWKGDDLGLVCCKEDIRAMYLDWELDDRVIQAQMEAIKQGAGQYLFTMMYRRCCLPFHLDLDSIRDEVNRHEINLLVVDTAGMAAGGDVNESEVVIQLFRSLRQLGVTSLLLAHQPKDKNNRTMIGSTYFESQSRNIWHIQKEQEDGASSMNLVLTNTKPFSTMPSHPPICLTVNFVNNGGDPGKVNTKAVFSLTPVSLLPKKKKSDKYLEFVEENPDCTVSDLCEEFPEDNEKSIRKALDRMVENGVLENTKPRGSKTNTYRVVEK